MCLMFSIRGPVGIAPEFRQRSRILDPINYFTAHEKRTYDYRNKYGHGMGWGIHNVKVFSIS